MWKRDNQCVSWNLLTSRFIRNTVYLYTLFLDAVLLKVSLHAPREFLNAFIMTAGFAFIVVPIVSN